MESKLMPSENGRLIVLLPESLSGNLDLARKIYWMAANSGKDVLYLTLLDRNDSILAVYREIVTMKAVTESNMVHAGSMLVPAALWFQKLQAILKPNDIVICQNEQFVRQGHFKSVKVAEYLVSSLDNKIITINGFYKPGSVQILTWLRAMFFWLGSLVILAGFTMLELQVNKVMRGISGTLILAAIVSLEFGTVWIWNKINHTS